MATRPPWSHEDGMTLLEMVITVASSRSPFVAILSAIGAMITSSASAPPADPHRGGVAQRGRVREAARDVRELRDPGRMTSARSAARCRPATPWRSTPSQVIDNAATRVTVVHLGDVPRERSRRAAHRSCGCAPTACRDGTCTRPSEDSQTVRVDQAEGDHVTRRRRAGATTSAASRSSSC